MKLIFLVCALDRGKLEFQGKFYITYKLSMGILNIFGKRYFKEGIYYRVLSFKLNIYDPLH